MPRTTIGDVELEYAVRPHDATYAFHFQDGVYRFRQWTWGEKNRVTDAATSLDPDSGQLRIDIAQFNELLLATCLVEAAELDSISPETLRGLHPVLGDTLLSMALWVNEVGVADKKSGPAGGARAAAASGPDSLSVVPGVRVDPTASARSTGGGYRKIRADSGRAGPPSSWTR